MKKAVGLLFLILLSITGLNLLSGQKKESQSLPSETVQEVQITPTPTHTPTPSPIKRVRRATIVLFGDSMIQTMGKAELLKASIENVYPDLIATIVNLAVGATTIEDGAKRIQVAIDAKPDIIIIESFAYNHLAKDESGLSRHRELLDEITSKLKTQNIGNIIILATIAPVEQYAHDASESAEWTLPFRKEEADWIKRYLENAIQFANAANIPLVDAYHRSLGTNGYGTPLYTNPNDDIHPSDRGHGLLSQLLVEKIKKLGWLATSKPY